VSVLELSKLFEQAIKLYEAVQNMNMPKIQKSELALIYKNAAIYYAEQLGWV
jgi:hypothetical protein